MTVPVGLATYVFLPDTPYTTRAWFLTQDERDIAAARVLKAGKAAPEKVTVATFKRILKSWKWYAFVMGYVVITTIIFVGCQAKISAQLFGSSCGGNGYFAIWLKSEGYSVVDRNIMPTGTSLISATCVVLWGFLSDYTGSRFAWLLIPMVRLTSRVKLEVD
jgi:ACS family pantothenate transporter-like MFS transporter